MYGAAADHSHIARAQFGLGTIKLNNRLVKFLDPQAYCPTFKQESGSNNRIAFLPPIRGWATRLPDVSVPSLSEISIRLPEFYAPNANQTCTSAE